jgi:hypothetical protein
VHDIRSVPSRIPGRTIVIDVNDVHAPPLENRSGYPNAFPRQGSKKVFENDHVVVWDYSWTRGQPTVMHFHDKDVVVVCAPSPPSSSEPAMDWPEGRSLRTAWCVAQGFHLPKRFGGPAVALAKAVSPAEPYTYSATGGQEHIRLRSP